MGFPEKYLHSLTSSNLQDDEMHHDTEALFAAAVADVTGAGLGALLSRVKFADGTVNKLFEGNAANLARLLRIWTEAVKQKGIERKWVKMGAAWDVAAAHSLFNRVALASLAHWLDGRCTACRGAGQMQDRRLCKCCSGSGKAEIAGGGFERERTLDMVCELDNFVIKHNARAAGRMRRSVLA